MLMHFQASKQVYFEDIPIGLTRFFTFWKLRISRLLFLFHKNNMMKKIMTKEEKDAKDTKNKRILALIIGVVMLFSTASYAFFSFNGNTNSNQALEKMSIAGIDFMKDDYGYWNFNISTMSFQTRYNPQETTNISMKINKTLSDFYNKMLYFGIDKLEDAAPDGNAEIVKNMGKYLTNSQFSCINENCSEDYPIKSCAENNVIIFKKSEVSSVSFDSNGCILIQYYTDDEMRGADAFLYGILGFKNV